MKQIVNVISFPIVIIVGVMIWISDKFSNRIEDQFASKRRRGNQWM